MKSELLLDYLKQGIDNLLEHEAFDNGWEFKPTQNEALHAYKNFLNDERLTPEQRLKGYFEIPTGVGKTAIFIGIIAAAHKAAEQNGDKLKTAVVVPTKQLLHQTLTAFQGNDLEPDDKDYFEGFAPQLKNKIGLFGDGKRSLSHPLTIMTYDAWYDLSQQGKINSENIDILISDEAHRGTSERRIENIKDIFNASTAQIAFTATAHFDEDKSVEASHEREIFYKPNGIVGATDLLKKTEISKSQRKYLQVITGSGETLLTLINDILDLSKIEAGELELNNEPVVIQDIIHTSIQSIAPRANEKDIDIKTNFPDNLPRCVMLDPIRIHQIILNLLGNAVKFVEKGYISTSVENIDEKEGLVTLRVTIEDTGIGIPEDKLESIFNKFEQADATTTKKYGGTGLGLAITKRLVDLMEGEIKVESKVGVGTKFWFDITCPVFENCSDECETKNNEKNHHLKVLVVDDSDVHRTFIERCLEQIGLEYDTALTEKQVPNLLTETSQSKEKMFDVLIFDSGRLNKGLLNVAQEIKENNSTKDIKIILKISDFEYKALQTDTLPFDSYLVKPINAYELRQAIFKVVETTHEKNEGEEERPLLNASILLVENEMVNQMVATEMLESMGCRVDLAENGQEACDMLADNNNKYNIVLMDCMMPIMDGFEATKAIRDSEKKTKKDHQIIIAMTANAMAGEKEKCLSVGMDDYLAKPVKEQDLYNKIKKYLNE